MNLAFIQHLLIESLSHSHWLAIGIAYLAGVLVSFTPCVYPMIPITAAIVSAKTAGADSPSKLKSLLLLFSYMLGIAGTYTALGVFAGLTGSLFGQWSSLPIFNGIIGGFFILWGVLMLDIVAIKKTIQPFTHPFAKHGFFQLFLWGVLSGFIFSPCTLPALGAILTYIGTTRDVLLGGLTMFAFSIGLCTLLIFIGLFSGFILLLPKSGAWMIIIKKIIGVSMVLLGVYYLLLGGKLI